MSKFIIDKSLQTNGNLIVQGDLDIKGTTNTVNQETLTIKDNFIAVNGNGTTLDTAGMAGIVAITGGEHYVLKNDALRFNIDKMIELFGISIIDYPDAPWKDAMGPYQIAYTNAENVERFNPTKLLGSVFVNEIPST